MTVQLPNTRATVRRRTEGALDAHGERRRADWGEPAHAADAMPTARIHQRDDGGYAIGLDPACWPVRVGDLVVDTDGHQYLVETTRLIENNVDPEVSWVRVGAQERLDSGTIPGGTWFVGRTPGGD